MVLTPLHSTYTNTYTNESDVGHSSKLGFQSSVLHSRASHWGYTHSELGAFFNEEELDGSLRILPLESISAVASAVLNHPTPPFSAVVGCFPRRLIGVNGTRGITPRWLRDNPQPRTPTLRPSTSSQSIRCMTALEVKHRLALEQRSMYRHRLVQGQLSELHPVQTARPSKTQSIKKTMKHTHKTASALDQTWAPL